MNLLTLADLKASRIPGLVGTCGDSDEFLDIINKAVRELMPRGEFEGLVVKMRVCAYSGCVVWPSSVKTVLSANVSGQTVQSRNGWYEMLPGNYGLVSANKRCGARLMEVDGLVPTFRKIPECEGAFLRVSIERDADVGKMMTFYGIDDNGNQLYTARSDGSYVPGVTITFAKPYTETTIRLRDIERVQKDRTVGPVHLYSTQGVAGDLIHLANYRPTDTNPMFRTTTFNTFRSMGCCSCNGAKTILAMVKLNFEPMILDDDLCLIQNQDAIEDMARSIRFADSFDANSAARWRASAIEKLNIDLAETQPPEQISVNNSGFGTAHPSRHGIGNIM
jgi:hypothetical protein